MKALSTAILIVFATATTAPSVNNRDLQAVHQVDYATQHAATYYVTTTGNDGWDCLSALTACASIQGAIDRLPRRIRHRIDISIGPGTWASGAVIEGYTIEADRLATVGSYYGGGKIVVSGTMDLATVASGSASFTATAVTVGSGSTLSWGSIVATGANWTPHDLKNKILRVVGGTGMYWDPPVSDVLIYDNTVDTITTLGSARVVAPAAFPSPGIGAQYQILDWKTIVGTGLVTGSSMQKAAGTSNAAFVVSAIPRDASLTAYGGNVIFRNLRVQNASDAGTAILDGIEGPLGVFGMFFDGTTGVAMRGPGGSVTAQSCYSLNPINLYPVLIQNYQYGGNLYVSGCYQDGGSGVAQYGGSAVIFGSFFKTRHRLEVSNTATIYGTRFDCSIGATGKCLEVGPLASNTGASLNEVMVVNSSDFSNAAFEVAEVTTSGMLTFNGVTGSNNLAVLNVHDGGMVYIDSASTITGTTEATVDGVPYSLAAIRAMTPKSVYSATTGARIWGN